MKNFYRDGVLGVLITAALVGCGGGSGGSDAGEAEGKLGDAAYVVVNAGDLEYNASLIRGSGRVAFNEPIGVIGSKKNYALSFSLEDGGALALVAHGNTKLQNGVEVTLSRAAGTLQAALSSGCKSTAPKVLDGVNAAAAMTINIDIHNDESPPHILIWSGSDFAEDKALLNSEEDGAILEQGSATFWGLILTKASVTAASILEPKFAEE